MKSRQLEYACELSRHSGNAKRWKIGSSVELPRDAIEGFEISYEPCPLVNRYVSSNRNTIRNIYNAPETPHYTFESQIIIQFRISNNVSTILPFQYQYLFLASISPMIYLFFSDVY